jgi:hypothetical protein
LIEGTLLQVNTPTLTDWITAISSAAMMIATAFVAYYAYVTIREGRKNRRKDTIEKMLENAYSPLYEILRRAKFGDERNIIRQAISPREYVLEEEEFTQVREIVERFGHYLGHQERIALTNALAKHDIYRDLPGGLYYRFRLVDIENHWIHVWKTCESLRKELEDLTKV